MDIVERLQTLLEPHVCAEVDESLSSKKKYPIFSAIVFNLGVHDNDTEPLLAELGDMIVSRFPKLHRRGVLTYVLGPGRRT